ncbi:MAG: ABC transporter permease [Chloroflexi bacterium]|nr:ABC transporter permease [Chloroflexota bacterium]
MITETLMALRRMRTRVVGWSIGLLAYVLLMAAMYENVAGMENLSDLYAAFPDEMLHFFKGLLELSTPQGYLDTYYYNYATVIVGLMAVGLGAGLVAGDEERGLMDVLLSHPVSRTALLWGRVLGMFAALLIVVLAGWLGWILPPASTSIGLSPMEMLLPSLALFAQLLLFGSLALLLSLLMPSGSSAGMTAGMLLVANYLLSGLANINPDLERFVRYTPLHFYQGGYAIQGLDWAALAGISGTALLLTTCAWLLFLRRDIRVGGEHSWELRLRRTGPREHSSDVPLHAD